MNERGESLDPVKVLKAASWLGLGVRLEGENRGLDLSVVRQPNRRVQRTRSSPSAHRSPLTRHPLGEGGWVRRRDRLVSFLALAMLAVNAAPQTTNEAVTLPTKPRLLEAFGVQRLSNTVTSMWFTSMPILKSGVKPALMVYYKGLPGWLDKKVAWKSDVLSDPALADFKIGEIHIVLQFWPAKKSMKVFGQEVSLSEHNVIVVTGTDDSTRAPVVRAVAAFSEAVPEGEIPAVYVLAHSPEARKALE